MTIRRAVSRRRFLAGLSGGLATVALQPRWVRAQALRELNAVEFGAVGDGIAMDTAALQKAIDSAAAKGGGRVIVPGGKRFLTGALVLRGGVDLHLADDAMLLASPAEKDYGDWPAVINGKRAQGVKISGTGMIDGQAMQFMTRYSEKDERWEPKAFRPRMFSLERCDDLEVTGIMFGHAPNWGLHLLGCERVLVDGVRIRNFLEVPNCDGIDPDHCRDVEIRNCDVVSADDAIVIKTSDQKEDFGPSRNITVKDCVVTSRDSGLKIGTETFGDISKVMFERCKVNSSGRGPTITHRQKGNIEDVEFRDIEITAEHHAARWWGWGEAVSVTAWPRRSGEEVGTLKNIRFRNVYGRAENSFRIDGQSGKRIEGLLIEDCDMTVGKWTMYPGAHFDNRPTMPGVEGLEPHDTPVYFLRNLKDVTVRRTAAHWDRDKQPYFSNALQAVHVEGLKLEGFTGDAARAGERSVLVQP